MSVHTRIEAAPTTHCIGYRIRTEYPVYPTAAFPYDRSSQDSETIYAREADAVADMLAKPSGRAGATESVVECHTNTSSLFHGRRHASKRAYRTNPETIEHYRKGVARG